MKLTRMNKLTHHTNRKAIRIKGYRQNLPNSFTMKPRGLWYSIDGSWEQWLIGEEWLSRLGKHKFEIELKYDNIFIAESIEDLIMLNEDYGKGVAEGLAIREIDWDKLSRDFNGIEFRNYHELKSKVQWSNDERLNYMDFMWYSSVDCNSGCLWNMKKEIKEIKSIIKNKKSCHILQ